MLRYYCVDEAGDPNLFNRHKATIVGTEGCTRYFILGLLDIADESRLTDELTDLRAKLLADPYLRDVPSMRPERRKTACLFHAKDDCPEVRREVFRLLVAHEVRFFAVVRDKLKIVEKVKARNFENPGYRYHPSQLYERCVSRLFRDRLHQDDGYSIYFSRRGTRERTEALERALQQARQNFRLRFDVEATAPIEVRERPSAALAGLQAVDYFLWALQRVYERGEDRYWQFVAEKASLVHDVDDVRNKAYGEYYTRANPLIAAKLLKEKPGI